MKKLIYIFAGLVAFSIGVAVYYLRPIVSAVPLCDIPQPVELYKFNEIRIKVYVDYAGGVDNDFGFHAVSDFKKGCITAALLDISDKLKKDETIIKLAGDLKQKNDELRKRESDDFYAAEVEIVGKIKEKIKWECSLGNPPPTFLIETKEIKIISPIRFISSEEISYFHSSK